MAALNLLGLLSLLLACVTAPLLPGIITRIKAFAAGRQGAPLLQPYYDIVKYLRKGAVYSRTTTWIFIAGPVVGLAALLCALLLVPLGRLNSVLAFQGDVLVFVYILGLTRFFLVLAALDTGSAFEGMGGSREVFFAALAEPVLLLGLLALCKDASSLSLSGIIGGTPHWAPVPALLTGASLFVIMLAENARIPVDDPTTHLELTMIHEVMALDHSGPDFAFINYTGALKLWLFCLITTRVLMPVHAAGVAAEALLTIVGMFIVAAGIGVVESIMARLRLTRVPQLLMGAGALAMLALLFGSGVIA